MKRIPACLVLVATIGTISYTATEVFAHSGGLDAAGCHAGSQPYHCHNGSSGTSDTGSRSNYDGSSYDGSPTYIYQPIDSPGNIIDLNLTDESSSYDKYIRAEVTSITDGDTIVVSSLENDTKGTSYTVRLACIDAPEMSQEPYGRIAKEAIEITIPPGTSIDLRVIDTDRYGRIVGEIIPNQGQFSGSNLNLLLVGSGLAFVYDKYIDPCDANAYYSAQQLAMDSQHVIWQATDLQKPWDYRRSGSSSSSETATEASQQSNYYPNCTAARNAGVTPLYSTDPGYSIQLDRDRDGIACE